MKIKYENLAKQALAGILLGILFAAVEYYFKMDTDDPEALIPLLLRACGSGVLIVVAVSYAEERISILLRKKPFLSHVVLRSVAFSVVITLCLALTNGIWYALNGESFLRQFTEYLFGEGYLINMIAIIFIMIVMVSLVQINSLHRKGEILNFILGKYHTPKEQELIFCFIDLTGSTSIAEKLGNYKYALFIKDYYSDISTAIQNTNAQVVDYVGDEVVLSWKYKEGIKNSNSLQCFFQMKEIIAAKKKDYIANYGTFPEFKGGVHGGTVVVTWVGEEKKEIVYIGDVMNTTSRIQAECKRLNKEFLISEELLQTMGDLHGIEASFADETVLRGKTIKMKLFALEH